MNLKRQYILPNCTLTLEGLSTDFGGTNATLSVLTNAQCQFINSKKIIYGGRAFVENLVRAVSAYAQECLSGVRPPGETNASEDQMYLESLGSRGHRLTWHPSPDANESESPVILDLTTVELFDLVEAVDQLVNDQRTLPDITPVLQPVSRRYRQVEEPVAKKAVPLALGVGSLALSALAFYFLPFAEIRKPEIKPPVVTPSQTTPVPQNLP